MTDAQQRPSHAQVHHGIPDGVFDRQCRVIAERIIDKKNLYPKSFSVMKKLFNIPSPQDFEQHLCPKGCLQFPFLPRGEWKNHVTDKCSKCGHRRFEQLSDKRGKRPPVLRPYARWWHFGLKFALSCAFADPSFTALRGDMANRERPNGLYQSRHAASLRAKNVPLDDPDASWYGYGGDGAQLFERKENSTWVYGLTCGLHVLHDRHDQRLD